MGREELFIVSCLVLVVIFAYALLTKKSRFESIKDGMAPHEKSVLLEEKPRKLEDVGKYSFYKFNWSKILMLDLGIFAVMLVYYFGRKPGEQKGSFLELAIITLIFVGVLTLIAFVLDYYKAGMRSEDKEYMYVYPVYKYDGVYRNCILFYYDIYTCKIESQTARLTEEERHQTYGDGLYYAIMKVKNKKIKFVKLYDEQE